MTHGYTQKKHSRYRYYVCLNAIKRGRKNCPTKSLNAILIEQKVIELLGTIVPDALEWQKLALEQQIELIRSLVKLIEYDGCKGKLRITLQKSSQKHELDLPLDQLKRLPGNANADKFFNEPPIRRQLLLAHQIQGMLNDGRIKDLNQLADWLRISKARLEQITNLLFLAPVIQEEIIYSDPLRLAKISERSLRPICQELDWKKQSKQWDGLSSTAQLTI